MSQQQVSLYYQEAGSDKEYHVQLDEKDDGFVVNFQYGRRGSALKAGTKTAQPLPQAAAQKIFDALVKEKTAKGYSPGAPGTAFSGTDLAPRVSGYTPMLLNVADAASLPELLADPRYALQEKYDGERRLVIVQDGVATGVNRLGLTVPLPTPVAAACAGLTAVLDGEALGDRLVVFDLLAQDNVDLQHEPWELRNARLLRLADRFGAAVQVAWSLRENKAQRLAELQARRAEGVVFKDVTATYTPGCPASGGPALKHKFVAMATVRVAGHTPGKRSVAMEVRDECGAYRSVGNVTVPVNQAIPAVGALIEVAYLYAYPGGSLFQPVLRGVRTDVGPEAATVAQLKYKATDDSE